MNKLLTYSKYLDFVHSIIKDSSTTEVVIKFKKVYEIFNSINLNEDKKVSLGKGYWTTFLVK